MISSLHGEIITYLAGKLPGVSVAAYTPDMRGTRALSLPSCLLELVSIDPYSDFGNRRDRSRVFLTFEARVIVDPNAATGWVDLKDFAAIVWCAMRDFVSETGNVGPVNVKGATEDVFRPGLDGFLVWMVEFEVEAYLDFAAEVVEPLLKKLTITDEFGNATEVEG